MECFELMDLDDTGTCSQLYSGDVTPTISCITGKIERADLEEAVKHNRDGTFFKRMGKPTKKVVTLKEYLKFFHVISKVKGDDTFQKILKHVITRSTKYPTHSQRCAAFPRSGRASHSYRPLNPHASARTTKTADVLQDSARRWCGCRAAQLPGPHTS